MPKALAVCATWAPMSPTPSTPRVSWSNVRYDCCPSLLPQTRLSWSAHVCLRFRSIAKMCNIVYSEILGPKTPERRVHVKSLLVVVLINASQPAKVDCSHTRLEHWSETPANEGGSATITDASLSTCSSGEVISIAVTAALPPHAAVRASAKPSTLLSTRTSVGGASEADTTRACEALVTLRCDPPPRQACRCTQDDTPGLDRPALCALC
mmetsp:Transcript_25070/g.54553  ORF Transcript_25070/g.54553 Transcript_25070/m.54553 type:complete len:210 (-) Transcript_25070:168-797(-)